MEKKKRVYTEASRAAMTRYDAENTVQFKMKLNKKTDSDILEKLNLQENKQGYVKKLIRNDMEKSGK